MIAWIKRLFRKKNKLALADEVADAVGIPYERRRAIAYSITGTADFIDRYYDLILAEAERNIYGH